MAQNPQAYLARAAKINIFINYSGLQPREGKRYRARLSSAQQKWLRA
ncbi:hypothetical protein [Microseira wollei]|uniref:Transposase n=1 Tax=Microseira wollei NIES-4236 TaxID=2530354 RepID=A0AAV3XAW3_9CYAN|nr:hypothetical protein [Microseira wollei]GET37544.1 hypothetical protein MiSe_22980 [Microseira wollei NIES-4236]